jgi:hypothetical protein
LSKLNESREILIIHFEELIENTKLITKKICDFLNIEWNSRMLAYEKYTNKIIDGKINYGRRIISKNKNKWESKLSTKEIKRIEEISYNTLIKLGYNIKFATNSKTISCFERYRDRFTDILAMLFIGNRHNKNNSFYQRLKEINNQIKIRLS